MCSYIKTSCKEPAYEGFRSSYEQFYAFQTFLKLSDGETFNRRKIEFLKDNLWLDKFTDRVYIKFAVYNGMLRMFTFVKVSFGFHSSGTFLPFDSVYGIGGTKVEIKSVNMQHDCEQKQCHQSSSQHLSNFARICR